MAETSVYHEPTAKLDREATALTLREQERLGQELHDTLGPQLTAISMLAASLHSRLQSRSAAETRVGREVARPHRTSQIPRSGAR